MSLYETAHGDRRVRLHVPDGKTPAHGWPLLILLDGDWIWPMQPAPAGLARCAVLLPGLASPDQARQRRALDYTPPAPGGGYWPDPRHPEWQGGGATAFLGELCGSMLRWAAGQAPLDAARTSLYGHSYGGLFALHALLQAPDAFAQVICASPSLWWHDGCMTARMRALHDAPPARAVRLMVMAGGEERWHSAPADPAAPGKRPGGVSTLPAIRQLVDGLRGIPTLDVQLEVLPGLGHGPMLPASARRAADLAAGLAPALA